jgi:hypothetical protein
MKKNLLLTILLISFFQASAQDNHSIYFNGSATVSCGTGAGLNITSNIVTLEAWIFPTTFATNYWEGSIIARDATNCTGYTLRSGAAGRLSFVIAVPGTAWVETVTGNNVLTLNTWQHVAAVYNGTTMKLYLNGVEISSINETRNIVGDATVPTMIGSSPGAWG